LVSDHLISAVGSPKTLATPGAFPSLIEGQDSTFASHRQIGDQASL